MSGQSHSKKRHYRKSCFNCDVKPQEKVQQDLKNMITNLMHHAKCPAML